MIYCELDGDGGVRDLSLEECYQRALKAAGAKYMSYHEAVTGRKSSCIYHKSCDNTKADFDMTAWQRYHLRCPVKRTLIDKTVTQHTVEASAEMSGVTAKQCLNTGNSIATVFMMPQEWVFTDCNKLRRRTEENTGTFQADYTIKVE